MKRVTTLVFAASVLFAAIAGSAGAAKPTERYALSGEARALEVAIGDQGATLGLALAHADSTPRSLGIGAGQCALLGDTADPDDLPCTDTTTERTQYPGTPGDENPTCSGGLPAPLNQVLKLEIACGSSRSFLAGGVPQTKNQGSVANLSGAAPASALLNLPVDDDQLVDDLTTALQPVLDQTPEEVRDVVTNVVDLIKGLDETQVIRAEIGASTSDITGAKGVVKVSSSSAAARIGLLALPDADLSSATVAAGDPLSSGLVIIEVGPSSASAEIERASAKASAEASAAIVTVKVRDITKEEPTYIELSLSPGETVTVLEGTPAESTITAADSTTKQGTGSAAAAADAVRLHLLKGVQGGIKLGLSRSTAAVRGAVEAAPAPDSKVKPKILPQTGARDVTYAGIVLVLLALALLGFRRKLS